MTRPLQSHERADSTGRPFTVGDCVRYRGKGHGSIGTVAAISPGRSGGEISVRLESGTVVPCYASELVKVPRA